VAIGALGNIARIRSVTDSGRRLYVEFRDGRTGTVDYQAAPGLAVGDVVLVVDQADDGLRLDPAPAELWGDEPWVGVVKLKLDDVTIIDAGGRLRRMPTTRVQYSVGNTVEVGEFAGVLRVLHEEPVRYIDLPAVDDAAIERFRIPPEETGKRSFDDFGGLTSVVRRAQELIELPLRMRSELREIGARPIKGVLFTGAPGTGKTMLARIIAAQAEAEFYEISGPEIFSKWYGQSGELLRGIFKSAASHPSAIVFFDEIDSVAARRGEESHEETKRVVAQLLTLMDGFNADTNVVVIATTNRPEDIDPALRRPGRFDWEIHFPTPNIDDREAILVASARGLATSASLPHQVIAANTNGWSAADLAAIWSEAALLAVADARRRISVEDYVGGFERVQRQRNEKRTMSLMRRPA
jgi:transitional endoplasmic reticulum ATPase